MKVAFLSLSANRIWTLQVWALSVMSPAWKPQRKNCPFCMWAKGSAASATTPSGWLESQTLIERGQQRLVSPCSRGATINLPEPRWQSGTSIWSRPAGATSKQIRSSLAPDHLWTLAAPPCTKWDSEVAFHVFQAWWGWKWKFCVQKTLNQVPTQSNLFPVLCLPLKAILKTQKMNS